MKKRFIFILIAVVFTLQFSEADSLDVFVGGGLTGYFIPTLNYEGIESTVTIPRTLLTPERTITSTYNSSNLLFGFAVSVPVGVIYNFYNGWGLGGLIELGYSFQGGPKVYHSDPPEFNTDGDDYVITNQRYIYNAFLGVINIVGRTPELGYGFRINMELGVILRPGALIGFDLTNRLDYPISSSADLPYRFLCYVGPNFLIGFQKELTKHLVIMPGLRLSAEFASYQITETNYVLKETYINGNFGIECRLLFDYNIALSGGKSNGGSSRKASSNQKKQENIKR